MIPKRNSDRVETDIEKEETVVVSCYNVLELYAATHGLPCDQISDPRTRTAVI